MDVTLDVNIASGGKLTALQVMQDSPVIPVIVLNDVSHAVPLAKALLEIGRAHV